ncbi:hypothetical protein [Micromonospora qiuiae]|uniref:hypothetical protein n=1 Tax=Micromonospora qiuiae TaxID=502268 RepID=UPI00194E352E|nr:hypothetical protein [Micromonospora qiuiae]
MNAASNTTSRPTRDNNPEITRRTTGTRTDHCANNPGLTQNNFNATNNSTKNRAAIIKTATCTYKTNAANCNNTPATDRTNPGPESSTPRTPRTASTNARPASPRTPRPITPAATTNSPPAADNSAATEPNDRANPAIRSGNTPGNNSPVNAAKNRATESGTSIATTPPVDRNGPPGVALSANRAGGDRSSAPASSISRGGPTDAGSSSSKVSDSSATAIDVMHLAGQPVFHASRLPKTSLMLAAAR